jgi:hypothetical protein
MKNRTTLRLLIIGAIVLALVSTSTVAISKSDLLSYYQSQPGAGQNKSMVIPPWAPLTPQIPSKETIEPVPTMVIPTFSIPSFETPSHPSWFNTDNPFPKFIAKPIQPLFPEEDTGDYLACPPYIPVGELHFTQGIFHVPHGENYHIATDDAGVTFVIKEGCPACIDCAPQRYSPIWV